MWYRLARELHLPLQECQQKTTSTEFVEWCLALEMLEWGERSKLEYYLAQLAQEVRVIREGFAENPKGVSLQDCLLPFDRVEPPTRPGARSRRRRQTSSSASSAKPPSRSEPSGPRREYEPGPELVKDPKWWAANVKARAVWLQRLGGDVKIAEE